LPRLAPELNAIHRANERPFPVAEKFGQLVRFNHNQLTGPAARGHGLRPLNGSIAAGASVGFAKSLMIVPCRSDFSRGPSGFAVNVNVTP
ncbi:MAG TPA: hypothetical protein VNV43_01345, partial [Candidatus Acidoferrales bacterium]|nr:hypothetical protein [Candidatus Acidoferrales bacterium]